MALVTESDILAIWRPLAAAGIKDGWRSIALDEFDGCRLRAACRSPGNEEALIIGFSALKLPAQNQLPQGYGFRVDKADLGEAGAGYSWLALVRQPAGSLELFSKMVTDIISTLQTSMTSKEDILFQQYLGRIRAWQNFMRRGREGLSPEEEVGLRGELELLMSLLTEGLPTFTALDSWKGPLDGLHDFELGCGSIEVKTTLSGEGFPAKIDSLEQLDDSQRYPLFLAGVRLQLAQIGTNLPQCIKDIREQLSSDPEALRCFELCMLHAGYLDSHDPLYTRVFTCAEINIHRVDDGFPRMTPFNVPSGVLSAKYEIDLGHLESERFTLDRVLDELGVF
ncbi:PD-(D/E)XK motif protein [Pseudomonas fragi]|uniref:PD-(D/E)XK motif protein n=1 Tax=Pseudomonas fragi TaxID=296 RepID=UPI0038150FC7